MQCAALCATASCGSFCNCSVSSVENDRSHLSQPPFYCTTTPSVMFQQAERLVTPVAMAAKQNGPIEVIKEQKKKKKEHFASNVL